MFLKNTYTNKKDCFQEYNLHYFIEYNQVLLASTTLSAYTLILVNIAISVKITILVTQAKLPGRSCLRLAEVVS